MGTYCRNANKPRWFVLIWLFWGYEGVLIGVILSQFVIICLWKPYFLYSQGLQSNASQYFIPLVGRLFIITIDFIAFKFIFSSYNISNIDNYLSWFLFTITIFFVVFIILFAEFYFLTSGMHSFTLRIYNIIINKFKNERFDNRHRQRYRHILGRTGTLYSFRIASLSLYLSISHAFVLFHKRYVRKTYKYKKLLNTKENAYLSLIYFIGFSV